MRLAVIFAKFGATERSTLFATTSRGGRISDLLKFCWPTFLFHGRKSCMLWPVICQGRTISQEALEWLRGWIGAHRDWSRKRLARELCVLWDWRNGKGRLKDF